MVAIIPYQITSRIFHYDHNQFKHLINIFKSTMYIYVDILMMRHKYRCVLHNLLHQQISIFG